MREILFKAKGRDGEGWREGYYWETSDTTYCFAEDYKNPDNTKHYLLFDEMTDWGMPNRKLRMDIAPETLCMYTGKADKNGKRIFENDIFEIEEKFIGIIKFGEYQNMNSVNIGFYIRWISKKAAYLRIDLGYWVDDEEVEVIGNVFDNPELLEK